MAASGRNPLDVYRRRAVFDVAEMAVLLEGEDFVAMRKTMWDTLVEDPLFAIPDRELAMDEKRQLAFRWNRRFAEYDFLPMDVLVKNPTKSLGAQEALIMLDCNAIAFGGSVSQPKS